MSFGLLLVVTIVLNGSENLEMTNLNKFWDDFNPDEHTEIWILSRGKGGCSESLLDLLTDAEKIKSSVFDLWTALAGEQLFGALKA